MIPLLTETENLYGFRIRLWRAVYKIQPTELLYKIRIYSYFSSIAHHIYIFSPNATCPCGLRGPPSWVWQECNRLLRLGRP